jgi:hypothetical protein
MNTMLNTQSQEYCSILLSYNEARSIYNIVSIRKRESESNGKNVQLSLTYIFVNILS